MARRKGPRLSEPADLQRHAAALMGDQADGLRRLFGASAVTLTVAARDTDVIDAYARIKRAVHERGCRRFRIVISHARNAAEAQSVFDNMQRVARDYLGVRLEYLGMADRAGAGDLAAVRAPSAPGCHA